MRLRIAIGLLLSAIYVSALGYPPPAYLNRYDTASDTNWVNGNLMTNVVATNVAPNTGPLPLSDMDGNVVTNTMLNVNFDGTSIHSDGSGDLTVVHLTAGSMITGPGAQVTGLTANQVSIGTLPGAVVLYAETNFDARGWTNQSASGVTANNFTVTGGAFNGPLAGNAATATTAAQSTNTAPHLGFVASGTRIPYAGGSGIFVEQMSRSHHVAMDNISSLKVAFANFFLGEQSPGGPADITATVEYPSNTFTRLTFSGNTNAVIANGGYVVSDTVNLAVPVPRYSMLWVREWCSNGQGTCFSQYEANTNYDSFVASGTTTPDITGGGGMAPSPSQQNWCAPLAIIGYTTKPSLLLLGDSRVFGFQDGTYSTSQNTDTNPFFGQSRILDEQAYCSANMGVSGETWSDFLAHDVNRLFFTNFSTAVYCQLGINGLPVGLATNYTYLASLISGLPLYASTLEPFSTSSDNFKTLANQTANASDSIRVQYNTLLRRGLVPGVISYMELANIVESSPNSGLWAVNGTSNNITYDGLHCNPLGYQRQADSVIDFTHGRNTLNPGGFANGDVNIPSGHYEYYGGYPVFVANPASDNYVLGTGTQTPSSGTDNIGIGNSTFNSLWVVPVGNIAIGKASLLNVAGNYNTAVGYESMVSLFSAGTGNSGYGYFSIFGLQQGNFNTASGYNVMSGLTTGTNNTVVGANSLLTLSSGNTFTIVGANSGNALIGGSNDMYFGNGAGSVVTNGASNIEIGSPGLAGDGLTTRIGSTQTNCVIAGPINPANATSFGTVVATNWILGGKYSFPYPVEVIANAALTVAAVAGASDLDLEVAGVTTNTSAIQTTALSIAMTYTNVIVAFVPVNTLFDLTNRSAGLLNSSAVVRGEYIIQ